MSCQLDTIAETDNGFMTCNLQDPSKLQFSFNNLLLLIKSEEEFYQLKSCLDNVEGRGCGKNNKGRRRYTIGLVQTPVFLVFNDDEIHEIRELFEMTAAHLATQNFLKQINL